MRAKPSGRVSRLHKMPRWVEATTKPNVALVTYCNYPPTTRLPELSRRNKKVYAALHGYTIDHVEEPLCTTCHPWMNKLLAIQRRLPLVAPRPPGSDTQAVIPHFVAVL